MPFEITPNMQIRRDKKEIVRSLTHNEQPYFSKKKTPPTHHPLANEYLHEVAQLYQIEDLIKELDRQVDGEIRDEGIRLSFKNEKVSGETHIIFYRQSYFGIPIWGSGFTVFLQDFPLRVIRSRNNLHYEIEKIATPKKDDKFLPNSDFLYSHLKTLAENAKTELVKINSQQLWIYKYDAKERQEGEPEKDVPLASIPLIFPLPPVPDTIRDGEYYAVNEVEFLLKMPYGKELKWRGFINIEDGTILYIRAGIVAVGAYVFEIDPISNTGDSSHLPESDTTNKQNQLNNQRLYVDLQNLTSTTPQELSGDYNELVDIKSPIIAPPTVSGTNEFTYDAWADDFAAVNAYYHVNTFIRHIERLGLNVSHFFGNITTFPIQTDHRACIPTNFGGCNAISVNAFFDSTDLSLNFLLANVSDTIGIAVDARVVVHELGHLILWNQRGDSGNLDFAHSYGDILAILFTDPKSPWAYQNDDDLRYRTFPFLYQVIDRRHDRKVRDGWGWGGTEDTGGYQSEQILTTTLFRLYLSMGGDDSNKERQQFACDYITYLLFRVTGRLGPLSSGALVVEDFVDDLISSDTYPSPYLVLATPISMSGNLDVTQLITRPSLTDGSAKKVIRWSFEKQGLYGGNSPEVDIFIDDGRDGEYQYVSYPKSTEIWNRHNPDGNFWHEKPTVGVKNYVYVKIKNRGTQVSSEVYVKGFMSPFGIGLSWPDDFKPLLTEELTYNAGIMPNRELTVGPFEWIPENFTDIVLISVSCLKDPSIIDRKRFQPSFPISQLEFQQLYQITPSWPLWRLTLLDNNIAIWGHSFFDPGMVTKIDEILDFIMYAERVWEIIIRNPFDKTSHIEVIPEFHHQFSSAGWDLRFMNLGMNAFTLGPRANKKLEFKLKPGKDFSKKLNEELESFLKIGNQKELIKSSLATKKRVENEKRGEKLGFRHQEKHIILDFLRLRVIINNFPIGHIDYSIRFNFKEK